MGRRYSDDFLEGIKPDSLVNAVRRQESKLAALQYEVVRLRRLSAIAQEGGTLDRADFGSAVLDAGGVHTNADQVDINWWLPLNLSVDEVTRVQAIAFDGVEYLYFGGEFTSIGGVPARHIARYSLVTRDWEPVGTNQDVIYNISGIAFDNDGEVYAAGYFTGLGNIYLARLVSDEWEEVAPNLNSYVMSMIFDSSNTLYIAGFFTNAGGDPDADRVAKLVGGSWEAVAPGLNGGVRQILFDQDEDLYAVGDFTGHISKLVSGSWTTLGNGISGTLMMGIAFDSNEILHICGNFSNAGGDPDADRVAKLVNGEWTPVGNGISSYTVKGMLFDAEDNLYIHGTFLSAGDDDTASGVARLVDGRWTGLSNAGGIRAQNPLDLIVEAMYLMDNGSLIIGGTFDTAGALQCQGIAIYCKPLNEAIDLIASLFEMYASYDASAYIEDAPADGSLYARKDRDWEAFAPAAVDGWRAMPTQPTRSSADDPTYVAVWTNTNYMSLLQEGLPVKWTQNSIDRYGFISSAPALTAGVHTTITILTRLDGSSADYDMLDTGTYPITNFCIGQPKQPGFGFPALPQYWTTSLVDSSNQNVNTPGTRIVNPGSLSLVVPIGAWNLEAEFVVWVEYTGTNTRHSVIGGIGNSNSSFYSDMRYYFLATSTDIIANGGYTIRKYVVFTSKTTLYVNVQCATSSPATSLISVRGSQRDTELHAVSAYL